MVVDDADSDSEGDSDANGVADGVGDEDGDDIVMVQEPILLSIVTPSAVAEKAPPANTVEPETTRSLTCVAALRPAPRGDHAAPFHEQM